MTTPGGVPNLPTGALTLDNLEPTLQDTSPDAMKGRAVDRFSSIFDGSTGLSPASDFTPFGLLTRLFAGFNSTVANADPADVNGPEDLPGLLLDFIEGLPVIGQFVILLEAIIGGYDGDDPTLKAISEIFAPIRALLQLFTGTGSGDGFPSLEQVITSVTGFLNVTGLLQQFMDALSAAFTGSSTTGNDPLSLLLSVITNTATVPFQVLDGIWAVLAQLTAVQTGAQNNPAGVAHSDDFATNVLSGRQTNVLGTMAISTLGPYLQTLNFAADYMGTSGAPRKPATNKCFIAIVLDAVSNGACRAWFCGDAAMTNYAAVEVYSGFSGDALRIVTGSSPTLTVIQAQIDLDDGMLAAGTVPKIEYDPTTNKFIVLRNMQPTGLEWEDVTNIVTHTTGKTFGGSVTNAYDRSDDGYRGPGIAKRTLDDW